MILGMFAKNRTKDIVNWLFYGLPKFSQNPSQCFQGCDMGGLNTDNSHNMDIFVRFLCWLKSRTLNFYMWMILHGHIVHLWPVTPCFVPLGYNSPPMYNCNYRRLWLIRLRLMINELSECTMPCAQDLPIWSVGWRGSNNDRVL